MAKTHFNYWSEGIESLPQTQNFLIPISSQPAGCVNHWYFKLRLFDLTELIVWNMKSLGDWVTKL